jgi:hypothetical protein
VQSQTFTQAYCVKILLKLPEAVHSKGLALGPTLGSSIVTTVQFTECTLPSSLWQKKNLVGLEHQPYSSDLAVSKIKVHLENTKLQDITDVQRKVMAVLKVFPREEFCNCFPTVTASLA